MIYFNTELVRLKSDGDRTVVLNSRCMLAGFFFNLPYDSTLRRGLRVTGTKRNDKREGKKPPKTHPTLDGWVSIFLRDATGLSHWLKFLSHSENGSAGGDVPLTVACQLHFLVCGMQLLPLSLEWGAWCFPTYPWNPYLKPQASDRNVWSILRVIVFKS